MENLPTYLYKCKTSYVEPSNGLRAGRRARDATERLLEGPGEEDELPLRGDAVTRVGPVRVDLGVLNFFWQFFKQKFEIAELIVDYKSCAKECIV